MRMLGLLRRRVKPSDEGWGDEDCRELLDAICPETGQAREQWYEKPYRELATWIGSHPMIAGGKPVRRIRWQRELALEGMQILDDLSTRNWAIVRGEERWHWHRVVYLRGLVWRLAGVIYDHELDLSVTEPPVELPRRKVRWEIDAGGLESGLLAAAGVFLGPGDVNTEIWYAWLDSFGAAPRPDNPVRIALEAAWRKLCERYQVWSDEEPARLMEGLDRSSAVQAMRTSASATEAEGRREMGVQAGHAEGATASESDTPHLTADSLLAHLAWGLEQGKIFANCTGATLHGTRDHVGLVVPLAWEWLGAEHGLAPKEIGRLLKAAQAELAEGNWGFLAKDRKGRERIRSVRLQLFARSRVPEALSSLPVNPDLVRRTA